MDADVHLAPEARVSLETHLGDIVIQGRAGRTAAKTGAGDIVADTCESAVMTTGTGDIRLPHVGSATLNTGAGDISVDDCSERVEIRTGTGDVHVGSSKGQLVVVSGAGDVHAVVDAGSAEVRTGMGDLTIQVPSDVAVWQDLTTGMGDVRSTVPSHGEPEPGEPYVSVTARSGAGDVSVVPAGNSWSTTMRL